MTLTRCEVCKEAISYDLAELFSGAPTELKQAEIFDRGLCSECLKKNPKRAKAGLAKLFKWIKTGKTSADMKYYESRKKALGVG